MLTHFAAEFNIPFRISLDFFYIHNVMSEFCGKFTPTLYLQSYSADAVEPR